jgi:putative thioredoxin
MASPGAKVGVHGGSFRDLHQMIFDAQAAAAAKAAPIKDGNTATFADDVIKGSMGQPVIVDFWAPWCGPCKQLTPVLERLVRQAGGKVRLVKINIDENQDLAAQLRIQSVPTVYAFIDGRPVDGFVGAQSESQVRQFIQRLTRGAVSPLDEAVEAAQQALDGGDAKLAIELFQRALSHDARHPKAIAGLIRARLRRGELAQARAFAKGLPADLVRNGDIAAAITAIDLAEETKDLGNGDEARRRLAANPADHEARFDLARALCGRGLYEAAVDELLAIIKADREWNEAAARKFLLRLFDALGPSHPLTQSARRRLSSLLFS